MSSLQRVCNLRLCHGSQKKGQAQFIHIKPNTNVGVQGTEEVLGRWSQAGLQDSNRIRKVVSADVVSSLAKNIHVPLFKREGLWKELATQSLSCRYLNWLSVNPKVPPSSANEHNLSSKIYHVICYHFFFFPSPSHASQIRKHLVFGLDNNVEFFFF